MNFESDVTVLPDFNTSDESIEREAAAAAGMTDPNYLNGGAPPLDPNYAPQPPAGPAPGAPAPGMPPAGAPQPGTPAPGGAPGYPPGTPFPGAPGAAPYPGAPQPGQPQPGAPAGQPGQAPPIDPFARFRGPDGRLNEQAIAAEFLRRENHTNSVLARMDQAIASGGGLSAEQLAQMRQQQQQQQAPQGGQAPPQAGPTLEDKLKAFYAEVGRTHGPAGPRAERAQDGGEALRNLSRGFLDQGRSPGSAEPPGGFRSVRAEPERAETGKRNEN